MTGLFEHDHSGNHHAARFTEQSKPAACGRNLAVGPAHSKRDSGSFHSRRARCHRMPETGPMGRAVFWRHDQVQGLADSPLGGVPKCFRRARAPETDDTGGISNHDSVIVQFSSRRMPAACSEELFGRDRRTVTSGGAFLSGLQKTLEQSQRLEAGMAAAADDQMIVDRDAQRPGGACHLARHGDVGLGGRGIAGLETVRPAHA